jgi:hypothetical protein
VAAQPYRAVNERPPGFWSKPMNDLVEKYRLVSLTFAVDISSHPIPITVRFAPKGQLCTKCLAEPGWPHPPQCRGQHPSEL